MVWCLLVLLALPGVLTQPDLCVLEKNQIKDLLQVSCVGKGLSGVPPDLPKDTGILLLRSNHLVQVSTASFQHLHNLTDLDLSYNGMGGLKADAPLPNLQELDVSHNALKDLPTLQGLPNLLRLALGHNTLSRLPEGGFRALGRLVDLELQGNQLQSLSLGAFEGLDALKDLDLSDNRLRALPAQMLAGLGTLETLRLERNQLRSVPDGFFPEGQIFLYVYLAENPWRCDCQLEYLRNWINENDFSMYVRVQGPEKEITENAPENVTCQAPPEEEGRPVMEFVAECGERGDGGGWGNEDLSDPWTGPGPTTPGRTATPPASTSSSPQPHLSSPDTPTTLGPKATPPASLPSSPQPHLSSPDTPTTLGPTATPLASPPSSPHTHLSSPDTPTTLGPKATPPASPPSSLHPHLTSPDTSTMLGRMATPPASPPNSPHPHPGSPDTSTVLGPTATPPASPPSSPHPHPGSLDATVRTSTAAPGALVTRAPWITTHFLMPPPPAPPDHCQCPLPPGVALGLTSPQASPVSWGSCLTAPCCLLRLVLYVACLVLVSLATLAAVFCWCGWVCPGWYPQATQGALGSPLIRYQQLAQATPERSHTPREGCQLLPRPCFYHVCHKLELRPFRHVTWLLISLPGPSGLWPWEHKGGSPSGSLYRGKNHFQVAQVKYAAATW